MGQGTRSEIKKLIRSGRVMVDGETVKKPELKIDETTQKVSLDGKQIGYAKKEYYMLHKPAGVISATKDDRDKTVLDLITDKKRNDLFPVGRLDKDTEGLLILTNDGAMAHRLLSPKFHVEKTYLVQLNIPVSEEDVIRMKEGVDIGEKRLTKPAEMKILAEKECLLTITEGKFHQVKRMFHQLGKEVVYLKRVEMAGIRLEDSLEKGQWRQLTEKEIEKLKEQADGKKEILCSEERKNTGNLSDMG